MAISTSMYLPSDPEFNLRFWLLGTIIGAITYGILLNIVFACIRQFSRLKSSKRLHQGVTQFHTFLFAYTIFMFLLSTLAVLSAVVATMELVLPTNNQQARAFARFGEVCPLVLASWASDCLMVRAQSYTGFMPLMSFSIE